ncbi:mucin-22-like [Haliotis cracherodii]|uniref:mucin-22-like n=1 Tax=Haliotis cracherodii TaxID=6455 RepID=UPI0039E958D5
MAVSTLSVHLLCLLCLIPASDERPSEQQHARFHSTHDMKDVIFQEDLLKGMKSSRVRCASQCHMLPKCKSYFYNKSARMCRLHARIFTDTTGAIPTQGWGYYGRHATSVKRNKTKTTTNTPGLESSTLNPEQTTEISTTAGITKFGSGDAATGTTQFPVKEVSEDARSPTTTGGRTLTEAGPRTTPTGTSTERSRLLATLTTKYVSQASSSTEKGGNLKNTLRSRMVTKPFVKLWAVTPESVPPGKVASISSTDSISTTEEGAESMSTHGSRVTIRRTTSNVMTPTSTTSTTSTTPTWTTRGKTDRDTTPNQNDKLLTEEISSASGNRSQEDNALNTSSYTDDSTETYSSMSVIPEETTPGHASQETPTSHHNEDQHDQLNFLTTEDEAKFFELSTGLVMPSLTVGDDDDEQGAITVMIIGDDDNDGDDTTQFIMEPDLESTMSVISIGGDDDILHEHILDPDSDDDDGEFPFTTDIAAFTREHGLQQDRSAGRKTTEVMQRSLYATLQLDKSVTNTGSTESPTCTGSSVTGKVAAYVVLGVVVPLLGVAGYALYRRWRTGPWTLLHKQDDGLGLQLVSST